MLLTTAQEVIDALMAGDTADELQPHILRLSTGEFHLLLTTARLLRRQIAAVCLQRADEIDRLLIYNTWTFISEQRWRAAHERRPDRRAIAGAPNKA